MSPDYLPGSLSRSSLSISFIRLYFGLKKIHPQCANQSPFVAEYGSCIGESVNLFVKLEVTVSLQQMTRNILQK
jgi:hypothetical protein